MDIVVCSLFVFHLTYIVNIITQALYGRSAYWMNIPALFCNFANCFHNRMITPGFCFPSWPLLSEDPQYDLFPILEFWEREAAAENLETWSHSGRSKSQSNEQSYLEEDTAKRVDIAFCCACSRRYYFRSHPPMCTFPRSGHSHGG